MLAAADLIGVLTALGGAAIVIHRRDALHHLAWGSLSLPGWILLFKVYGLYDRDRKRVSHSTVDDAPRIFHAMMIGSLGVWLLTWASQTSPMTLSEVGVFFALGLVTTLTYRALVRLWARISLPPERVVFVGGGPIARMLIGKIRQHPEYRLEPVGFVDTRGSSGTDVSDEDSSGSGPGLPYLGEVSALEAVCLDVGAERVVVVSPEIASDVVVEAIRLTKGLDLRVSLLPDTADVLGPSVEIDDVEGVTVLGINPPALTRSSRLIKRGMDVTLAALTLLVLAPALALVALLVKVTSPGPVFFAQERIGCGGRRFHMYKFRTMVADAEARAAELRALSAHPVWLLLDNDPRITRFGRVLRHLSLDELPQLWNVLKGDMSLVGPRPMPPDVDHLISGWGRRRLDLTPGITGMWQVLGRTKIPFEEMVKLDYLYVTNWSLWQDIRLLIHTLPAVMRRRGVN